MTTTEDIIEDYIELHYGPACTEMRKSFREQLELLVAVAKSEQLREDAMGVPTDTRLAGRAAVH